MYTFFMILFILLSIVLATFILIQQGKGDLGLGSVSGQMLFGGSGGQDFFEKATWIMGAIFILGALGLSMLKSKEIRSSVLEGATVPQSDRKLPAQPTKPSQPAKSEESAEPVEATKQETKPTPSEAPLKKEVPSTDKAEQKAAGAAA